MGVSDSGGKLSGGDGMSWEHANLLAHCISYYIHRTRLTQFVESGPILDIGGGDGMVLAKLGEIYKNGSYYGLSSVYEAAVAKENNPNAAILVGLFQDLPIRSGSIYLAISSNIFDYAEESLGLKLESGTLLRIRPATFKLEDLAREVKRVLVSGGIYIPFESLSEKYYSLDVWTIFERHLEPLRKESSVFKIFRKA